jgi:hypothetical protein
MLNQDTGNDGGSKTIQAATRTHHSLAAMSGTGRLQPVSPEWAYDPFGAPGHRLKMVDHHLRNHYHEGLAPLVRLKRVELALEFGDPFLSRSAMLSARLMTALTSSLRATPRPDKMAFLRSFCAKKIRC